MNSIRAISVILVLLSIFSSPVKSQEELTLTIEITGAKAGRGQILLALFSSADDYLKRPLIKEVIPVDDSGSASYEFSALTPGTYAISAVYDEDSNGIMSTGLFRIPTELVGFSNNARGRFGPPSFDEVSFSLSESTGIQIRLGKAKD